MAYLTHKLEFSIDPLSDTTPAWTDISQYLVEADWFSGKQRDLDDPQAGGATFRLKNTNRRFEPEYAAGAYYPNIVPMRRFRWTITADGVTYPQGIYYAQSWQVSYPDQGSTYSEVVVSCVDGFGILASQALPALSPPSASSIADVITDDTPFAYYRLGEPNGKTMTADAGPEGTYRGNFTLGAPSGVVGDTGTGLTITANGYGRAKLDDENVWFDAGQLTVECVVTRTNGLSDIFVGGPWDTTAADTSFGIDYGGVWMYNAGAVFRNVGWSGGTLGAGTYHLALTYDGSKLSAYFNGVLDGTDTATGNIISPDANEFIYVGRAQNHSAVSTSGVDTISNVAFYTYALNAAQIASHANAALFRGYATQKTGSRVTSLATYPLWSTAGITSGQVINVQPRMQTGQPILDEIIATTKAETPFGLFFFDDSGNPAYQGIDYNSTLDTTLGELEVQYDAIELVYDDEVWNESTVANDQGASHTVDNTTSQGQYGVRTQDETSLIINDQTGVNQISQAIVDGFSTAMYRIASVSMNGAAQNRRVQILTREIGDVIRVKRRGEGGTANPDIQTRILGKQKHLDVNRNLTCTWNLARGFPAGDAHWHLGQAGYGELGQTTVLA